MLVNIPTNLNDIKQNFSVSKEDRYKYGEINTPFSLIDDMLKLIPSGEFSKPMKKWLDIGTGCGYFTISLFKKLDKGLTKIIPNDKERKEHIIKNMLYMTEIKKDNCDILYDLFGKDCNLFQGDFLVAPISYKFDFVIGNPPYNNNGIKKVPTNIMQDKKDDGKTVWVPFIKKSISLLKPGGKMIVIIPSIWMKPDKAKMYDFMTQYKLEKIHCMSNTETNKIFNGLAQTPTCYFLLTKTKNRGHISLYDKDCKQYIKWSINSQKPIPIFGSNILNKFYSKLNDENKLIVYKSNLPTKNSKFSNTYDNIEFPYMNIKTCTLIEKTTPKLVVNYSNIKQKYDGKIKLIFAHKMYGFPYLDISGSYGISNRDNYVIMDKSTEDLKKLQQFFSTKTALYLFETTRYRMKYLEKYIFELIPDITKLPNFPQEINDETISDYFELTDDDKEFIQNLHKKKYQWFC